MDLCVDYMGFLSSNALLGSLREKMRIEDLASYDPNFLFKVTDDSNRKEISCKDGNSIVD